MLSVIRRVVMICVTFVAGAVFASFVAYAWNGPPCMDPDDCNVAAPVNVGTTEQRKDGILGVNGLAVFGNAIISGVSRYLNFGTSVGQGGYGFRDNAGNMEFKDSGGEWVPFNGLGGEDGKDGEPGQDAVLPSGITCGWRGVTCHGSSVYPSGAQANPKYSEPNIPCHGVTLTTSCIWVNVPAGDADFYDAVVLPGYCPSGFTGVVLSPSGGHSSGAPPSHAYPTGVPPVLTAFITCVKN